MPFEMRRFVRLWNQLAAEGLVDEAGGSQYRRCLRHLSRAGNHNPLLHRLAAWIAADVRPDIDRNGDEETKSDAFTLYKNHVLYTLGVDFFLR